MFGAPAGGELSPVFVNWLLLALWGILPALLLAYGRQSLLARGPCPQFCLHKSEAAELDRALLLYQKISSRLKELEEDEQKRDWLGRIVLAVRSIADSPDAGERADLEAHADHLRTTIIRLRGLPLDRLKSWTRALSLRLALGRGLAVHVAALALLLLTLHISGQPLLAQTLPGAARSLAWHAFDQTVFQANAAAAGFAAISIPAFYLGRRRSLGRTFGLEFCVLKELASTPLGQQIDRSAPSIDPCIDPWVAAPPVADQAPERWFTILGIEQSADVDEIRRAYRARIKQNHPDRVQDLAPAIREFAEAETKKINAAYREALASLPDAG
jgi:DnaJ domain